MSFFRAKTYGAGMLARWCFGWNKLWKFNYLNKKNKFEIQNSLKHKCKGYVFSKKKIDVFM